MLTEKYQESRISERILIKQSVALQLEFRRVVDLQLGLQPLEMLVVRL